MALPIDLEQRLFSAAVRYAEAVHSGGREDLSELIEATSSLPLTNLEEWEWVIRRALDRVPETKSEPTSFRPKPTVTWLDLCNRSGYERERTLRSLPGVVPNRFFLAIAVRRLNDWVPQIRKAARDRLPSIAMASNPEDVVDVLWATLPHYLTWGRNEFESREALLGMLGVDAVAQRLKVRISSAVEGPAATILTQAARTPALDRHLAQIAESAVQPAVRAKAFRFLLEGKASWFAHRYRYFATGFSMPVLESRDLTVRFDFERILTTASEDRSPAVRRVAADLLGRSGLNARSHVLVERATKLASDRFPSVADRAKFALKELAKASLAPVTGAPS